MQPIVFVDLDGVLVDLKKGLGQIVGIDLAEVVGDEFHNIFVEFTKSLSYGETVEFWKNLPKTIDCDQIWKAVKFYKPLILTSISGVEAAAYGKQLWCWNNLGIESARVFCTKNSNEKQFYASKKSILIDDFGKNIRQFEDAGGTVIHHTDTASTINQFKKFIQTHWLYS